MIRTIQNKLVQVQDEYGTQIGVSYTRGYFVDTLGDFDEIIDQKMLTIGDVTMKLVNPGSSLYLNPNSTANSSTSTRPVAQVLRNGKVLLELRTEEVFGGYVDDIVGYMGDVMTMFTKPAPTTSA